MIRINMSIIVEKQSIKRIKKIVFTLLIIILKNDGKKRKSELGKYKIIMIIVKIKNE